MYRNFKLFIGVYKDLQARAQNQDDYDLIKTGGLLRQLMLDGERLLDIVNRRHKLSLKFKILNHAKINRLVPEWPHSDEFPNIIDKEVIIFYWRNLDPSPAYSPVKQRSLTSENISSFESHTDEAALLDEIPLRIENVVDETTGQGETRSLSYNILRYNKVIPTINLNRDRFLKTTCILYDRHKYTVRDLISSAANLRGGVHQGGKPSDKDRTLFDLDDLIKIAGLEASIAMMLGISNVVLQAIEPLYIRVIDDESYLRLRPM